MLICSYYFPSLHLCIPPRRRVALHLAPGAKSLHYIFNVVCNYSATLDTSGASARFRSSVNLNWWTVSVALKTGSLSSKAGEEHKFSWARTAACYVSERRGKNISCLRRYLLACSVWQCSRFAPAHSFHRLFIDFPYLCQPPQHARVNITPHGVCMRLRLRDTMSCAVHGLWRCLILNRQKDGVVNVKLAKKKKKIQSCNDQLCDTSCRIVGLIFVQARVKRSTQVNFTLAHS